MSSASLYKETCPKCGKEQEIERYNSINDYHKELFPKIVDKTIFDYTCKCCGKTIHAPYPLLFHKMGVRDIQIGYLIPPVAHSFLPFNPLLTAMKEVMHNAGQEYKDIAECYYNEDEFANRVATFIQ